MIRTAMILLLVACSSPPAAPDAPAPLSLGGTFAVKSRFQLAALPPMAAGALGKLAAMTDDADDPSRYLVDRLVDAMPDGQAKTVAHDLAPVVAAYLQLRLADIAPQFVPSTRAIAARFLALARDFTTVEHWTIAVDGSVGISIPSVELAGVTLGLPHDLDTSAKLAMDPLGGIAIAPHPRVLDYGELLRLGLDHAAIPSVDPNATDLAQACRDLLDCSKVGAHVASCLGFGAPSTYAAACNVALTTAAADLYDQLPATAPLSLSLSGAGHGLDSDGDRTIDAFEGIWTGTADNGPLGAATFSGQRR